MARNATRAQNRNTKRAAGYATARGETATVKPIARDRERSGLEWLLHKRRITVAQAKAGRTYGEDFRIAESHGMSSLRSCLNDQPGGGNGFGLSPIVNEHEAIQRLRLARETALHDNQDMITACNLVCGRQLTPWQIIVMTGGSQRDAEKLQTTLAIACDLLAKHYRGA